MYHVHTETLSLIKQQFVITHTIHHTDIHTLLDSWVTKTPPVKMLCPQKKLLLLIPS